MSKLDDAISHLIGDDIFGGKTLIVVAMVFLVLCTDILDNFFEDENMWVWAILIFLLLCKFEQDC